MTAARSSWRGVIAPLVSSRVVIAGAVLLTITVVVPTIGIGNAGSDLVQWDAQSYMAIAGHGYPATPSYLDAFLPGFPLLVRAASFVTQDVVSAALLVCLAAEAFALYFVSRMVAAERDAKAARFAALLLAFAPTAVFLTAPFTEAPFIAAAAAALFWGRQGRAAASCGAAAVAVALRVTGLALLPALALELLLRSRWRANRDLLWLALIPLPLVVYCAYMAMHSGDALAIFHAESSPSFGQAPAWPWNGLATSWNTMVATSDGEVRSIFAREIAFGLLGLAACAGMWVSHRIPRSFALYCSIAWLMTASLSFWRSEPRYILALFPALLLTVDLTAPFRVARPAMVAASAVLMCLGTVVFAEGRWLG
ncbi:MAG: hypothetical protein JOZ92_05215 [Candidatus Dormibacteraeota bacterium]|nr:hypothetical protein [Candidatus Dormibacteraeota bacterium]